MRRPALLTAGLTAAALALSPVLVGTAGASPRPVAHHAAGPARVAGAPHAVARPTARVVVVAGFLTATSTVSTAATGTATVTVTVTLPRHGRQAATSTRVEVGPQAVVLRNGRRVTGASLRIRDAVLVRAVQVAGGPVVATGVIAVGRPVSVSSR